MLRRLTRKRKPASCAYMLPTQGAASRTKFYPVSSPTQPVKRIYELNRDNPYMYLETNTCYTGSNPGSSAPVIATCTTGSGSTGVQPTAIATNNCQLGINTICTASTSYTTFPTHQPYM